MLNCATADALLPLWNSSVCFKRRALASFRTLRGLARPPRPSSPARSAACAVLFLPVFPLCRSQIDTQVYVVDPNDISKKSPIGEVGELIVTRTCAPASRLPPPAPRTHRGSEARPDTPGVGRHTLLCLHRELPRRARLFIPRGTCVLLLSWAEGL